jgi:hypothetical protein
MIFTISFTLSIFFVANSQFLEKETEKSSDDWPCALDKQSVLKEFKSKKLTNPYPKFEKDPYRNQIKELNEKINKTLSNSEIVCAIRYKDPILRNEYEIKNFESKTLAVENGFIVTHQGICGACSNLNDLAVYLSGDLTTPVRKCGMLTSISNKRAKKCLVDLGFTETCSQIWLFNAINTRKNCFKTCIVSWIKNEPFADKDGNLNECILCDEVISGPIFKYFSGRSRRNSGIESEITRPGEQIYDISHCYY